MQTLTSLWIRRNRSWRREYIRKVPANGLKHLKNARLTQLNELEVGWTNKNKLGAILKNGGTNKNKLRIMPKTGGIAELNYATVREKIFRHDLWAELF